LLRVRRIDVYGLCRRLFLREHTRATEKTKNERNANCETPPHHCACIIR
jgi:hypothetical protein